MRIRTTLAAVTVLGLLATACGGGEDAASDETPVDGTFTTSITADPGNLHPHLTVLSATRAVDAYMYDKLVHFTQDGEPQPWLAESWEVSPNSVTYTLHEGVTCSDGSELTASDVAANFNFVTDPANESPINGVMVPTDVEATADDAAHTVTITTPEPRPFLMHGTADLFIVCRAGLEDPSSLAAAGGGTGMFELTDSVADDYYTFTRRDDYAWGPNGAAAEDPGVPRTVTLRVIPNESTAVNLFLSDELDAVSAVGPDRERLVAEDTDHVQMETLTGELFFNQADGRLGEDPDVRAALAQALDYEELQSVLTGGFGAPATTLSAVEPRVCHFDAVDGHLPAPDIDAAKAALDAAGWTEGPDGVRSKNGEPLTVSLIYNSSRGNATAAGAELMATTWSELGIDATSRGMAPTEYNEVIFATGDWDAALLPINVRLPSQLVPFLSGATPAAGGSNMASLTNDDYTAAVAEAMTKAGEDSCDDWMAAEQALYANHDVIAFANETIPTYLDGVTTEIGSDGVVPPTIRLTGGA